jgi:hypothetical protein
MAVTEIRATLGATQAGNRRQEPEKIVLIRPGCDCRCGLANSAAPMTALIDYLPEFPLPWEMSAAERFALIGLVSRLRPEVAIEIGTHFGGSLQVLEAYSGRVHAIDCNPEVARQLAGRFPRTRFHVGESREKIPEVLAEIEAAPESLGFVLGDGDHSASGVQADIEALLCHRPRGPVLVLLHDSFNPDCRAGIRRAGWGRSAFVHSLELDYVVGGYHPTAQGGAFARSMWGGFALALLRPEPRTGELIITAAQESMHGFVFRQSAHRVWHKVARRLRRFSSTPP